MNAMQFTSLQPEFLQFILVRLDTLEYKYFVHKCKFLVNKYLDQLFRLFWSGLNAFLV